MMHGAMTAWDCLRIIGVVLLVGVLMWGVDRLLYPPVPDRLETRRRRATPWYR